MAWIERRGAKRYRVRYRGPDGHERSRTFARRVDAEAFSHSVEVAKLEGSWVDPRLGKVTVADYAARWLASKPTLRPKTLDSYQRVIDLHIGPAFGRRALSSLTTEQVRHWHAKIVQTRGPAIAAKCYRVLRAVYNTAVTDGLVARNPCRVRGAGEERAAERPLITAANLAMLIENAPVDLRAVVALAAGCGLRLGEVLGLHVEDVDVEAGVVRVRRQQQEVDGKLTFSEPKTEAGRRAVAIPPPLLPVIAERLLHQATPGELVFPIRRKRIYAMWNETRTVAGLEQLRLHDLRHFSATLAAVSGATTRELMSRLGHASPVAALRYQHAAAERDTEIASRIGELMRPAASTRPGRSRKVGQRA